MSSKFDIDLTELDYNGFCDSEDDNVKSFLSKKEKPYTSNNTLGLYVSCTTYDDKKHYHFANIARTYPLWDEEVKKILRVEKDGKKVDVLSKDSFSIVNTENTSEKISLPMNSGMFRDIQLQDILMLSFNELKIVQELKSKEEILKCRSIRPEIRLLLRWCWNRGAKYIVPTDLIYISFLHASRTNGNNYRGMPVILETDLLKELVGGPRKVYLRGVLQSDLKECDYKAKDFDYFPFKVTLEGNNIIYIDRKDLASMYRKNQIKF